MAIYPYKDLIGTYWMEEEDGCITRLRFGVCPTADDNREETPLLREAHGQLQAYFAGQLRRFTLPLRPQGTPFQQTVWELLREIPYGTTATYGEIASRAGNPKASRAVGMANNRNPIAIFIPCHRVIGSNGRLVGYAGGLDLKRLLLDIEQNAIRWEEDTKQTV